MRSGGNQVTLMQWHQLDMWTFLELVIWSCVCIHIVLLELVSYVGRHLLELLFVI